MTVYYNEIDHAAVVWLEALIKEKLIPYGNAINVEAAKAFVEAHQASRKPLSDRAREIAGIA